MNTYPQIKLEEKGEIRFGPIYCTALIDGKKLKNRTFGCKQTRSKDSRYAALEEWLTTDYGKGPITRLFLIDFGTNKFSEFKTIDKGFVENISFLDNELVYQKRFVNTTEEVSVDLQNIENWKELILY